MCISSVVQWFYLCLYMKNRRKNTPDAFELVGLAPPALLLAWFINPGRGGGGIHPGKDLLIQGGCSRNVFFNNV